jgi:hypothetical protein
MMLLLGDGENKEGRPPWQYILSWTLPVSFLSVTYSKVPTTMMFFSNAWGQTAID